LRAINACDTQFFAAILPRIDIDQGALCPPAYTESVAYGDLDRLVTSRFPRDLSVETLFERQRS